MGKRSLDLYFEGGVGVYWLLLKVIPNLTMNMNRTLLENVPSIDKHIARQERNKKVRKNV